MQGRRGLLETAGIDHSQQGFTLPRVWNHRPTPLAKLRNTEIY
jgi:hypothetical protein